jgi:ParB/RepB/Spo0J family partition protein
VATSTKKTTDKPKAAKKAAPKQPTKKKKKSAVKPRTDVPKNLSLPLTRIELSDEWNRLELGDNSGMVSSMKELGQITPISVYPIPGSTKYRLVAGRRRYAAAVELGWKTIDISVIKGGTTKQQLTALVENLQREENTPYELALTFHSLVEKHGKTNEEIAQSCGKTSGFVSQHLAVMRAPKKLQKGLAKGTVGVSIFRYFAKLDQIEDKVFYAKMMEAALEGLAGAKIDQRIAAYLDKKAASSKTPGTKPKKGAAAHKKKKGAELEIRDYKDPEVRKAVTMINKTTAIARLETVADKLKRATKKDRQMYLQGVLDGIEECTGLIEVSSD